MRHHIFSPIVVLVLCACISNWADRRSEGNSFVLTPLEPGPLLRVPRGVLTLDGISLGMSRREVEELSGEAKVKFDPDGRASQVLGERLEINGVDFSPSKSFENGYLEALRPVLGWPDGQSDDHREFALDFYYLDEGLVLRCGCGGWVVVCLNSNLSAEGMFPFREPGWRNK